MIKNNINNIYNTLQLKEKKRNKSSKERVS